MSRASVIAIWIGFWFLFQILYKLANVLMAASKLGTMENTFWFMKLWVLVAGVVVLYILEISFIWIESRIHGEI